jgi:TonB family protein
MDPYQLMLLKTWAISYLVNSLWQLPFIALATIVIARLARSLGLPWQHRVWVTALFAELTVPALQFELTPAVLTQIATRITELIFSRGTDAKHGSVLVAVTPVQALHTGFSLRPAILIPLATLYLASVVFFAARLLWGLQKTRILRATAESVSKSSPLPSQVKHYLNRLSQNAAHTAAPLIALSPNVKSPVTLGAFHCALLLPADFLDRVQGEDIDAVLAHECAHIHRRDYAKNLAFELLSLPIAFHPIVWFTRARLAETRELVCDQLAASVIGGNHTYAHALLRIAALISTSAPGQTLHAIGIFDANIFERRIMQLTQRPNSLKATSRIAVLAAIATVALATGISAVALRASVAAEDHTTNPGIVRVKQDQMKVISRTNPVYPQAAKEAKVQGTVVIGAIISKDGIAEKLKVVSGPKELQRSAIEAVSHWKWEPYLLNGEPVEVETEMTVIYALEK